MTRSAAPIGPCGSSTPSAHDASSVQRQAMPSDRARRLLGMETAGHVVEVRGASMHRMLSDAALGPYPPYGGRCCCRAASRIEQADIPSLQAALRGLVHAAAM